MVIKQTLQMQYFRALYLHMLNLDLEHVIAMAYGLQ